MELEMNRGEQGQMYLHAEVTEIIIGAFYEVYGYLGYGFLEKVYQNALRIELTQRGVSVVKEMPINVTYRGEVVGQYYVDLLVEDKVLVEIKAARTFSEEHEAQLLNYLKATPFEVGLLLNFGAKPQVKRRIFENQRKEWWQKENIQQE